ncbi:hypothetical protein [Glaciibacter psychrotolerans]|uniref:Uncharacterized protein n=1 Tax=Glaciibacter psychrotolerans TaxID=670054 RepID=A0A7Z0EHP0_9MICO|nr:hypothetical protein [Leifsonia psychrotolerans]NYJ21044.1 hypothetical protein [Leifsonia psychrotolerans]
MYIDGLTDLRHKAQGHFGPRATYRATYEDDPQKGENGYVKFVLYDSFVFDFGFMEPPLTALGFSLELAERTSETVLLGKDLLFIENREPDVEDAFRVVDEYCRLRLPDKFLQVYDALE